MTSTRAERAASTRHKLLDAAVEQFLDKPYDEVSVHDLAHAAGVAYGLVSVLVRGDTIIAAGCILPLSQKPLTDRALGTRHRAALGLSDESDALVVVVSEERSTVSVAERGRLWRDLSTAELRELLSGRALARSALVSASLAYRSCASMASVAAPTSPSSETLRTDTT